MHLPENAEGQVVLPAEALAEADSPAARQARADIFEILSHTYPTGRAATAARHNEHQP